MADISRRCAGASNRCAGDGVRMIEIEFASGTQLRDKMVSADGAEARYSFGHQPKALLIKPDYAIYH